MEAEIYKFLEREEGRVLHSYQDTAGVWTIGVGSTRYQSGKHVGPNELITDDQADILRNWEVGNKADAIRALTKGVTLKDKQIVALISFTYNEGIGALQKSTLLKKIIADPSDPSIRDEFMKWNKIHVDGQLVKSHGLTDRRKREADLYFS